MTRQLEVTIRARNNLLIQERLRHGYKTQTALARAVQMAVPAYNGFETFRISPIGPTTKEWTVDALRVAEFFGVQPGELWPEALLEIKGSLKLTALMDAHELGSGGSARLALPADTVAEEHELNEKIQGVLERLERRRRFAVVKKLGLDGDEPWILEDIGRALGVTRERARGLYMDGINKLRTISVRGKYGLADYHGDEEPVRGGITLTTHR